MSTSGRPTGPRYSFENDLSGRLFCWLIESGRVDYRLMIERTGEGNPDSESWAKRLAESLKASIGRDWRPPPQPPGQISGDDTHLRPQAPAYTIWFRPSPSKKIKFKEVARGLLVFTCRIPETDL
jgi:hypothetical protein